MVIAEKKKFLALDDKGFTGAKAKNQRTHTGGNAAPAAR
jgi:hypothetical protein